MPAPVHLLLSPTQTWTSIRPICNGLLTTLACVLLLIRCTAARHCCSIVSQGHLGTARCLQVRLVPSISTSVHPLIPTWLTMRYHSPIAVVAGTALVTCSCRAALFACTENVTCIATISSNLASDVCFSPPSAERHWLWLRQPTWALVQLAGSPL